MSSQTESESRQYEVEHTVESGFEDGHEIATLSERESNRLQMQEIKRRTVRKNLMKLSVINVSSSDGNEKWVIDVRHPIHDQDDDSDHFRFFLDKPITGWTREYKIVRMMDYYGISSGDPHMLEFEDLYVEKNPEESEQTHDWMLVPPPNYDAPVGVQIRERLGEARHVMGSFASALGGLRFDRTVERVWIVLLVSSVVGSAMTVNLVTSTDFTGSVYLFSFIVTTIAFILGTITSLLLFGGDE